MIQPQTLKTSCPNFWKTKHLWAQIARRFLDHCRMCDFSTITEHCGSISALEPEKNLWSMTARLVYEFISDLTGSRIGSRSVFKGKQWCSCSLFSQIFLWWKWLSGTCIVFLLCTATHQMNDAGKRFISKLSLHYWM